MPADRSARDLTMRSVFSVQCNLIKCVCVAVLLVPVLPTKAWAQTESVEYYALDAVGSVRVVFEGTGAVAARQDFTPFGRELTNMPSGPDRKFAGLFRDAESGLDYAEARSFQARTGRFSAPDPIYAALSDPQRLNRYSYAKENPLRYIDPNGLHAWVPEDGIAISISATAPIIDYTPFGLAIPGNGPVGSLGYTQGGRPGRGSSEPGSPPPTPPQAPPTTEEPPVIVIIDKGAGYPERESNDPCKEPDAPKGHSVRANVHTTIATVDSPYLTWLNKIKPGGVWDYKTYDKDYTKYEAMGNVNFGATGMALGIPSAVLKAGAGAANVWVRPQRLIDDTVSFGNWYDDYRDQQQIQRGIDFFVGGCHTK